MLPANHDDAREDVLQGLGGRPVVCRRASDDSAQEPAGPVDTEEADRLQPPGLPLLAGLGRPDPGPKLDAEPAVGLVSRTTGLGDRGGDLAPHVIPEAAGLRGGERLQLKRAVSAQHGDQRPLVLREVQLDLESLAHRHLEAAEVDPFMRWELLLRVPRARHARANQHGFRAGQPALRVGQHRLLDGQQGLLVGRPGLLVQQKLLLGGVLLLSSTIRLRSELIRTLTATSTEHRSPPLLSSVAAIAAGDRGVSPGRPEAAVTPR